MNHRPEIDVLIAAAMPPRARGGSNGVAEPAWKGDLDWPKLHDLALYHRLAPLLYARLAEFAPAAVPPEVLQSLAAEARDTAARSLHLTHELVLLVNAFETAGIAVLPHKGPLLGQAAYGDLALRPCSDLDLLVHPRDVPAALDLLAQRGFLCGEKLRWVPPATLARWSAELMCASPRAAIDLHWQLTPNHYTVHLPAEILWRSTATVRLAGSDLPTLTPEALLLLLAVHGAKHAWECLGWLADIAWLLEGVGGEAPDLDRALQLAEEADCRRPLFLALALSQAVFGSRVPEAVASQTLNYPGISGLLDRVRARWFDGPLETPGTAELFAFAKALAERPSQTLRHYLALLFYPTEAEWQRLRLPSALFWLYAPYRAIRLAIRTLRRG